MADERETDRNGVNSNQTEPRASGSSLSGPGHPGRSSASKRWIVIVAAVLLLSAVAVALLLRRGSSSDEGRPVPAPTGVAVPSPSGETASGTQPKPGEIVITLSRDKIDGAQIRTEAASEQNGAGQPAAGGMRTTGIVQSNAYRETPVFPLAGGIVREVSAQLGDRVRREQPLAVVFSTELSEAQGSYLKAVAEFEEHHKHHQRALQLLEIGAISREEVEMAASNYKSAEANVSTTRERLMLLGMTPQQADALRGSGQVKSLISVSAPASGTVLNRAVNPGEVVDKGKEMFRIADLSTVWVIAQIYENDFAKVRVGTPTAVTTPAYPGRVFNGRVSYIDPRVDSNTRTAQVRMELGNPGEVLKFGMFVDVSFGGTTPTSAGQPVAVVPRQAIQTIGAKQVVFVASDLPGVFIQREVTIGPEANGVVPVYSGLRAGEQVVTEGSFLLRAESLKLNPAQPNTPTPSTSTQPAGQPPQPQSKVTGRAPGSSSVGTDQEIQTAKVVLTKDGYRPASIRVRKDLPLQLTFVRQAEATCGTEITIPQYGITRELPLNEPVMVELTPNKLGEVSFVCGMGMLHGKIVVREK